ncbi:MAG TPA: protein kinase [Thermomicrobiales bacterium]|nr:protein kinase [Thermomicrobiales bacterium]
MSGWLGRTIGNYRIEASLGVGGMGRVFRAVHVHINRVAAIKVLHEQIAIDPAFQARFLREAQAVAALHHPNIVDILDFNEDDGVFYLVMEYVPDGSLRTLLREQSEQGRTLSLATGLELICQAADALDYAHRAGMVHRDIKPDNLLLKRDPLTGRLIVKVADFGLARMSDSTALTIEGQAMGTPAYMSPEQCQGIDLDGRSDIYSLGVVLFEVATGAVPFVMKSLTDAIYKHVYVAPPSPRDVQPDLPEALNAIILRCLAKDPDERFATASQFADALQRLIAGGIEDLPLAATIAHELPAEQLRVMLDSGEVPLTPGEASALTVTIANLGQTPVLANISIDGIPDDWVAAPPRDVQIEPGAEVSGPIRVEVPLDAAIDPGTYPVVVRVASRGNPALSAEATTRLLVRVGDSGPPTIAVPPLIGGPPPPDGDVAAGDASGTPSWLWVAAVVVLLLVVAGIAYALLQSDDPDEEDDLLAGGETATITGTAPTSGSATSTEAEDAATSAATATGVVIVDPAGTATVAGEAAETPTEEAEAPATETPATVVPAEFIVFSAGRNLDDPAGTLDIYVMDPDGANQRPLISEPDDDWLADISPDGTRVVWVSRRHGNHQIYIAMIDGSDVRRLTTSTGDDLHPLWSPNGNDILFVRNEDGDDELYIVNAGDGALRRLTDNDAYDGFASWSPDGTRIAWTSGIEGNNELYALDMTDPAATPQQLTDSSANDFNPVWSPDGAQLAFVSNRFGDNDIFVMPADASSETVQLTTNSANDFAPDWSPDGSKIAFCRVKEATHDVLAVNADGSGEQVLATNASPNDPDITWSPNSARLAYLSEDAGHYDVWSVATDGSQPVQLTDAPGNDANLTWFGP